MIANSVEISIDEYSNIDGNDFVCRCKSYHKIVENIEDYKLGMTPYVVNSDHNSEVTKSQRNRRRQRRLQIFLKSLHSKLGKLM